MSAFRVVFAVYVEVDALDSWEASAVASRAAGFPLTMFRRPEDYVDVHGRLNGKEVTGRIVGASVLAVDKRDNGAGGAG